MNTKGRRVLVSGLSSTPQTTLAHPPHPQQPRSTTTYHPQNQHFSQHVWPRLQVLHDWQWCRSDPVVQRKLISPSFWPSAHEWLLQAKTGNDGGFSSRAQSGAANNANAGNAAATGSASGPKGGNGGKK